MARLPRLAVPGHPHHILLRGNAGQPIVRDDADRSLLLQLWGDYAQAYRVALHAWVLLDDQVQLLATPEDDALSQWMQAIGRRYVRYFNDRHGRTGTLWEGRYRSTVLERERYLLACMVHMDLQPVASGMVARPADHRWSSHAHYAGAAFDRLVTPPAEYWALGNTPFAREAAYAELVHRGIGGATEAALVDATRNGWALGSEAFLQTLQGQTERRLHRVKAGRPRKSQPV